MVAHKFIPIPPAVSPQRPDQQFRRWCGAGCFEALVVDMRRKGSKVHMAVDTLGHLIELTVTPANEQERSQVKQLCEAVQRATGETVEVAWADQGYTGWRSRPASGMCT